MSLPYWFGTGCRCRRKRPFLPHPRWDRGEPIDLAAACSSVPLRFVIVPPSPGRTRVRRTCPKNMRELRTAGGRGNEAPSPHRSSRSRDRSVEERQVSEDHRVDGSESCVVGTK